MSFNTNDLPFVDPSKTRRVAIVTGCNSGIGYYTALHLYTHGWVVYMACRSEKKAEAAKAEIEAEAKDRKDSLPAGTVFGTLKFIALDLSDFTAIEASANKFKQLEKSLDVLINNAAVFCPYTLTKDGLELQTQTNAIGPFFYTTLLVDVLKKSSQPRVVFVSSIIHKYAVGDWFHPVKRRPDPLWCNVRYGNTKAANVHTALTLSEKNRDILVFAVHPGIAFNTGLGNYIKEHRVFGFVAKPAMEGWTNRFGVTAEEGAYTPLQAALYEYPAASVKNFRYLIPYGVEAPASAECSDSAKAQKSWDTCVGLLTERGFSVK